MNDSNARERSEHPNALSAISITVRPDRRSRGLAGFMIEAMKQTAIERDLQVLVVPLRPTRKTYYPFVDIAEYISWNQSQISSSTIDDRSLPFDPWLRTHVRLGAQAIKLAPCSMRIEGSVLEWQKWTGIDFASDEQDVRTRQYSACRYREMAFHGGLVPLKYYAKEGRCVYVEPNVWLYHDLHPVW